MPANISHVVLIVPSVPGGMAEWPTPGPVSVAASQALCPTLAFDNFPGERTCVYISIHLMQWMVHLPEPHLPYGMTFHGELLLCCSFERMDVLAEPERLQVVLRERQPNKAFVDIGGNRELPALVTLLPDLHKAGAHLLPLQPIAPWQPCMMQHHPRPSHTHHGSHA